MSSRYSGTSRFSSAVSMCAITSTCGSRPEPRSFALSNPSTWNRPEELFITISIRMNNSSGIYQVDGLLKAKLRGSGLEPYVEVIAHIDTEAEKRLVPLYQLDL